MFKLFSADVYSFVEILCGAEEKHLLLLPGYLETDHPRGKLKKKNHASFTGKS